jgi:hypothetical protein
MVMASYNLGFSWDIVVDGDYLLNDIEDSIMDVIYACIPTIRI